jgi:protein TonB
MNFSKKNHSIVGQNEKTVKTSQKHDVNVQKNTTLYFQVGLILTLLAVYGMFEMQFEFKPFTPEAIEVIDEPDFVVHKYVPEAIPEPVKEAPKTPEPQKLLAANFTPVEDDVPVETKLENVITELPSEPSPSLTEIPDVVEPPVDHGPIDFVAVEQVPIYPGCEGLATNEAFRDCMSQKIAKLINRKFNGDLIADLGLSGRQNIYVQFKIDKTGNVVDIKARAPHDKLEREAIKVVGKIPQMIPGKQRDKNVEVMYLLPIRLQVQ